MQQQMLQMMAAINKNHTCSTLQQSRDHTLQTAMSNDLQSRDNTLQTAVRNDNVTPGSGTYGVPPDMLPHMDILSSSIRKAIVQGKDINLSSLLIPGYEVDNAQNQNSNQADKRLSDHLSITEFLTAFGKFKRVMCDSFPQRSK